jgi:hypothetical protein
LLSLLILGIGAFSTCLTYVLKDFADLLLRELKSHHHALMSEIVLEDEFVIFGVKLSVSLLNGVPSLLELLSEFVHHGVSVVSGLRVLEATCLVETI